MLPNFLHYLQTLGFTGERGPDMRGFVRDLRSQGQHPRRDFGLAGLAMGGQMPQMPAQGWMPGYGPQMGGSLAPQGHPMWEPAHVGLGFASGEPMDLMALARRRHPLQLR